MSGQNHLTSFHLSDEGGLQHYPLLFNSNLHVSVLMKIEESFGQLLELNPSIIGTRAVALLEEISTEEAICAIEEFCNRYRWASHKIHRSISGYFRGVCKKYWKQNREQHKANLMRAMKMAAANGDEAAVEAQKATIIDQVVDILFTKASGLSKDLVCQQKRKVLLKFDYIDAIEALYEFCNAAMYREHKIRSMHAYLANIIKRRENNPNSVTKLRHIQKRKANNRIKRIRALKQDSGRADPVDECRSILNRLKVSNPETPPPQIDIPSFRYEDSRQLSGMSMGSTPHERLLLGDGIGSGSNSCRSSSMDQQLNGNQAAEESSPHGSALSFGSNGGHAHVNNVGHAHVNNVGPAAYIYRQRFVDVNPQPARRAVAASFQDTYPAVQPNSPEEILMADQFGYQLARTPSPPPAMNANSKGTGEPYYWGPAETAY